MASARSITLFLAIVSTAHSLTVSKSDPEYTLTKDFTNKGWWDQDNGRISDWDELKDADGKRWVQGNKALTNANCAQKCNERAACLGYDTLGPDVKCYLLKEEIFDNNGRLQWWDPAEKASHYWRVTPAPAPAPTPAAGGGGGGGGGEAGAFGDPHITNLNGDSFDLYKTGWSTFAQIPQHVASGEVAELVIDGNVVPYWGSNPCQPAYIRAVTMAGRWMSRPVAIHAGSLETTAPFAVHIGSHWETFDNVSRNISFADPTFQLSAVVDDPEPALWGPDAHVTMEVGNHVRIGVKQHTEGRLESSNAMLDLTIEAIGGQKFAVGGWLGDAASLNPGAPKEGCAPSAPKLGQVRAHGAMSGVATARHFQ